MASAGGATYCVEYSFECFRSMCLALKPHFFFFFTDVRRETGASVYYFFPLLTFTCWMRYEHKFFVQIGLARTKQQLRPRPARGLKKTCGYETKARVYNPPPTPHRPEECGGPPDVYPRPFFAAGELIG